MVIRKSKDPLTQEISF